MNKLFVSLVLALSVSASSLVAVESSPKALNKADSALLFGANAQNVDVIALSEEEMQNTKGEAIDPISIGIYIGAGIAGGALGAAGADLWDEIKSWF